MKPPKVVIPIDVVDTLGCVYKIYSERKYIVVMGKSMYWSVESINKDIERYFKGLSDNPELNKNNLYAKFYEYLLDNPKNKLTIQMVASTDNAYQLLKSCQIELDRGKLDGNCLNSTFTPYVNKWLQYAPSKRKVGYKWWINRGSYLNFCNWRKKHPFPAF
jgi:hypothetical protein